MNADGSHGAPSVGDGRHETRDEQLDRNWSELLQELRVMQTGVQIIAGFLLTLPFQQRFTTLDATRRGAFLFLVVVSAVATALMLAPVSLHRRLFRHHVKETLVASGDRIVKIVLVCVALLITGTVWLVFSVVASPAAGNTAGGALLAVIISLLLVFPLIMGRWHHGRDL